MQIKGTRTDPIVPLSRTPLSFRLLPTVHSGTETKAEDSFESGSIEESAVRWKSFGLIHCRPEWSSMLGVERELLLTPIPTAPFFYSFLPIKASRLDVSLGTFLDKEVSPMAVPPYCGISRAIDTPAFDEHRCYMLDCSLRHQERPSSRVCASHWFSEPLTFFAVVPFCRC